MSTHSYSRCWLHLIWETLRREPMLDKRAAAKAADNVYTYCTEKGIYLKINYFNADHTHALIDLPTNLSIEQVIQLLKGSSSHWINQKRLLKGRFAWLLWAIIHVYLLVGFDNRLRVSLQWLWAYITYERGARLIMSDARSKALPE